MEGECLQHQEWQFYRKYRDCCLSGGLGVKRVDVLLGVGGDSENGEKMVLLYLRVKFVNDI